ncbi:hypothetical protein KIN20_032351 [Parelaphostrongylus tenuis]|uniref:Aminotransferase class V domain-containing protein n=1 Tax=Parelaphostrongylus tenuis TaxID=148309 RepID=A0AAD5R6X6_PARTN|nr:hypothetical protein KIN20_032351 [Parelaphostrongylus tenuis]
MLHRVFGERIPAIETDDPEKRLASGNTDDLLAWIRENEIGSNVVIETPFGRRYAIYCDYTASARAIRPIEDYILENVLPLYGNTHSSVTVSSEQTTLFVHEARQEIRSMTGAGDGDDVIFTGSGSTAAVELLIHLMQPEKLVVITSIHEHHSNLLPWRTVSEATYLVRESRDGGIDLDDLVRVLNEARTTHPQSQLLAAFTACSNITGICMDVPQVTSILKRHNALSVWDYASSAPYVKIEVNGAHPIDAVFFSGHKFIGAVSTPGVLVVKKSLIKATAPKRIGGGTVFFVSRKDEWYLKDAEYREEGGTPDSVGIIRLALAVKLKRAVGEAAIAAQEMQKTELLFKGLKDCCNLIMLGAPITTGRLAVLSFLIKDPVSRLFFHHNYISALLNDLFGIQSRAGCMCAGPYAQHLMGIDEELAEQYFTALKESDGLDRTHLRRVGEYSSNELLRPGFTRISVPYFWTDRQVDHLVECIRFVAERAADFIHLYQLNCESAEWHHQKQRTFHARKWLGHVTFTRNGMVLEERKRDTSEPVPLTSSIIEAHRLADESLAVMKKAAVPDGRLAIDHRYSHLRWFVLPIEIIERSRGVNISYPVPPFQPLVYAAEADLFEKSLNGSQVISCTVATKSGDDEATVIDGVEDDIGTEEEENLFSAGKQCLSCDLGGNDSSGRVKGEMEEDIATDDETESSKVLDNWDKRVIVRSRELSRAEEMKIPWYAPPLEMYKRVCEAIHGLDMIKEGDKVLVCLSGGKDSLSLLHILHFYQMRCRKNKSTNFKLGAITVDPGSSAYNPRPLIDYCRSLNIDFFYEEQDIIGAAKRLKFVRSICAYCSRMKRGRLAAAAQHHGWNVLAMGQHLDDVAESFFIAAFQNGNLSTMKAQYQTRDGTLRVIRPLIFVRERALREFAESRRLPVIAENCPACFNQATERHRIKQLLAQQELIFPDLFNSLRSALRPLLLVDSARTDKMRTMAIENIVKFNKNKGV